MTTALTHEQIASLPEGLETDRLVAEYVLNYRWWRHVSDGTRFLFLDTPPLGFHATPADGTEPLDPDLARFLPRYSTDSSAAIGITAHFNTMSIHRPDQDDDYRTTLVGFLTGDPYKGGVATAPTLPLSICRAALFAVLESASVTLDAYLEDPR